MLGFGAEGGQLHLGLRVWGLGLGFRVWGLGFRDIGPFKGGYGGIWGSSGFEGLI